MADIYDVAAQFRRELQRRELRACADLVKRYGQAWQRIRSEIMDVTARYYEALGDGREPKLSWLYEFDRLQVLRQQVEREIAQYAQWADGRVQVEQWEAIQAGHRYASASIGREVAEVGVAFGRLPNEAFIDLVGFTSGGAPLKALLAELGPEASEAVAQGLITGLAVGHGPREIAREIRDALGGNLARALRISRTETQRAFRESTRRDYEKSSVVEGWEWFSALDNRTCPMCLAMHGTIHPKSERLDDHPNGRCVMLPVVRGEDYGQRETGEEWFEKQDEATQRQVLGNAAYEAYKSGEVRLSDFVGQRQNEDWGTTRYTRSLSQIYANDGVPAIRWDARADQVIGRRDDQRNLYPENEPGREFLGSRGVLLSPERIAHLGEHDEARLGWLKKHTDLLYKAVQSPVLVYRYLDFKPLTQRWHQTLVAGDVDGHYVTVVIGLAKHPGESDIVITIFPIGERNLFKRDSLGNLVPRSRWMQVKRGDPVGRRHVGIAQRQ